MSDGARRTATAARAAAWAALCLLQPAPAAPAGPTLAGASPTPAGATMNGSNGPSTPVTTPTPAPARRDCRIQRIEIERGGFGRAELSTLTIDAAGHAGLVTAAQARHGGGSERRVDGSIERRDFARLATQARRARLMQLPELIDDPTLADGDWGRITVHCAPGRGPTTHAVWWREGAEPAALRALADALWAWQARQLGGEGR